MMKKVMIVFGTRPEAIKMIPIIKEIEKEETMEKIIVTTGQHKAMLKQVLEEFNVKADYSLNIMKDEQTVTYITEAVINEMTNIISKERPDIVLVHGDTTTSFATAISAFYNQVKIGHVEAGLRTYNKYSPYPEEMNRTLISHLADFHFAPTEENKQNLLKENIEAEKIFVTGNTIIDTMKLTITNDYKFEDKELNKIEFSNNKKYILLTTHRRENLNGQIRNICKAINELIKRENIEVIFPVHYNPKVRNIVFNTLEKENSKIHLLEPINVFDMHNLMNKIDLVLTDSGGLQEEAPTIGKNVLVLRENTERPEVLKTGLVKIIGTDTEKIIEETERVLENMQEEEMLKGNTPYGDGHSAEKIIHILKEQN